MLECTDLATCKQILKRLHINGLDVKKEQAQLALTLTATNHVQLREQLSKLKGHQRRYQRLDEAGMGRAKEILKMRYKLRKPSSQQAREKMEEELQALLHEHSREKLLCKARMLKLDIRKLLRAGAKIQPLASSHNLIFPSVAMTHCRRCNAHKLDVTNGKGPDHNACQSKPPRLETQIHSLIWICIGWIVTPPPLWCFCTS